MKFPSNSRNFDEKILSKMDPWTNMPTYNRLHFETWALIQYKDVVLPI